MDQKDKKIEDLKKFIASAEENLEAAKKALFELTGEEISASKVSRTFAPGKVLEGGTVIEGTFDGENMLGPEDKVFPVPANYASKSKLVEGDRLKLTIAEDGSFIFKQIGPIERKNLVGTLVFENNAYSVLSEGKSYNILYASATYFKAKPGDKVTIIVPEKEDSKWAALENIIHELPVENTANSEVQESLSEKTDPASNEGLDADFFVPTAPITTNETPNPAPTEPEPVTENTDTLLSNVPDFPDLDVSPTPEPVAENTPTVPLAPTEPAGQQENSILEDNFFEKLESNPNPSPSVAQNPVPAAVNTDTPTEIKELDI